MLGLLELGHVNAQATSVKPLKDTSCYKLLVIKSYLSICRDVVREMTLT